jgi:hypothetical protein
MNEWLRAPMTIDRANFLVLLGGLVIAFVSLPMTIQSRDERRIRAIEFAQSVRDRAEREPSTSAGT